MTAASTAGEGAAPGVLDDGSLRRVVGALCLGQVTSWGVLYYALPVLSTDIARETGWSVAAVLAAFSVGLVVNAVAGIAVGRAIDRVGPRRVMTAGSVLAVPAVVAVALAPNLPLFVLAWVVAGLAMSATLYAPSFAAVTGWAGADVARRVRALTAVTLVGGLASTVFAPLTAALAGPLGWRGTYLVLAVVLGVLTVPAHVLGLRGRWAPPRSGSGPADVPAWPPRQPVFWVMAAAFTLGVLAVYGGVVNLVPLLVEHGTPLATASVVLGIGGVGQVAGRLVWAPVASRVPLVARTVVVLALVAGTTALFAVVPGPLGALVALSFLAGTARGVMTLLQATAVSDRWGATDFGRHQGLFTAPVMLASAVSPWAGAVLASGLGSYAAAFGVLAALALVAAALVPLTVPRPAGRARATGRNILVTEFSAPIVVIGGGQSGLAAAHTLQAAGAPTMLLEARDRTVGSWPDYYDSLTLFSPARYSCLPGMPFPGDPDHYPTRDETAAYLARYAATLDVDIRTGARVERVVADGRGFVIEPDAGTPITASGVVAATGSYAKPYRPALDGQDTFTGRVLHVVDYREPTAFTGLRVVVVGGGNSAVQVADELARHARVTLATHQPVGFLPQRPHGEDVHYWTHTTGFDRLPPEWLAMIVTAPLVSDVDGYSEALAQGVYERRPMFDALDGDDVVWSDGTSEPVDVVLLATGYVPNFDYLDDLGALDEHGRPRHSGGISTTHAGLVYLGLEFQRSFSSNTLRGVGDDAAYVVPPLLAYARNAPAAIGL